MLLNLLTGPPPTQKKKKIGPASAHSLNLKRKFQSSEVSLTFSLCLCDTLEFVVFCKGGFFFRRLLPLLPFVLSLDIFQNNCLLLGRLGVFPLTAVDCDLTAVRAGVGTRCADKFHPILRRSAWFAAGLKSCVGVSEFMLIPLVHGGRKLFISLS